MAAPRPREKKKKRSGTAPAHKSSSKLLPKKRGAASRQARHRKRVLIFSSNRMLVVALRALCGKSREFSVCAEAATLREVDEGWEQWRPDVLVLDLASTSEAERQRTFDSLVGRLSAPHPVILVLAGSGNPEAAPTTLALKSGACSAVTLNDAPQEWQLALAAAWRGASHRSPAAAAVIAPGEAEPPRIPVSPHLKALSAREREILELTRAGMMPRQIAERLGRSIKTIEAHYSRIKAKLGLESVARLREAAD